MYPEYIKNFESNFQEVLNNYYHGYSSVKRKTIIYYECEKDYINSTVQDCYLDMMNRYKGKYVQIK